jgi:hypothetical protein
MRLARSLALVAALVLPACIMQTPNEQDLRTRAPGAYTAQAPDGTALSLQINADGTANLNGQQGTWDIKFGRIFFSDGKQEAPADLSGDQLTVYLPQGQVVFVRAGTQAAPPPAGTVAADTAVAGGAPPATAGAPAAPAAPAGPQNLELKAQLTGCWENVGGSSGGTGSSSSTTRLALGADGSFQYRSFVSVSAGELSSSSESNASGTYRVEGNTLFTDATQGDSGSFTVSFDRGILVLNGLKYAPCSG